LESIRELATNLSREHSRLAPQDDERAALDALNTSFAASQVFPNGHVLALYELSGLYQGDRSDPTLEAAYEHELQAQLLPRLARLLEDQIRANRNDREQLMNSLRAYLMLSLREHRDSDWLSEWVAANWSVRYRGDSATQEALGLHLQRLLQQPFRYPVNDALVSETRQILRADSLVNLVYRALQDQARHLPEYRLSQNLGPQGAMFTGSDYAIPGFYTQRGYQQNFIVNGPSLVSRILRENWVLGEGAEISGMDLRRLLGELEQVYFRDYANHWGEAVGRVGLQSFTYAADGADLATSLTAASSPLIQLLIEVRDNTRFVALTEVSAALAPPEVLKSSGVGGVAAVTAEKVTADTVVDTAKKSLQRRFEPLHRLLDDTNGPAADLLPALQALNELQLQLSNLARSSQQDQAAYEWARARMVSQRDALGGLRNATRRLPQPVGTWLNTVADDTWSLVLSDAYQFLNQRYQSELYSFYLKAIDKRYPFNAHSTSDVALNDFREFFKAQGVADKFFDGYIRAFTSNDSGGYRLRSVDGRSLPMSRVYLEQMAHVQTIRGSFFAENPNEPQVQFKLEPHTLDPGVSRAEFRFGNQVMEYRHGPIVPASFKWPADADDGRTSLVLEKSAGRALGLEENTGPWSLFRLFDLMQNEYLRGRDVMVLKANVGGLRVNYLLSSQRSPNPFEMNSIRRFRLAGQL
jgi:type VI secretion system protein ImpL